MKAGYYVICVFLCLVFLSFPAFAAPVGLTSEADLLESGQFFRDLNAMGLGLSLGFYADILDGRDIDIDGGKFEMDAYMMRLSVTTKERFALYFDIGQTRNKEYSYVFFDENHKIAYEDEVAWGVGINAMIYRWDNGIEVGTHAGYRQCKLNLDSVTIDGVQYRPNALTNISEENYQEYQAAIEVGWKTDYIIPYIGAKYSDVKLGSDFTLAPQAYNAKGKSSESYLGAFVGVTITPDLPFYRDTKQLAINVESRFIDEQAISAGVTYKF